MTRADLAALVNERGRICTNHARAGSARRRLMVSLTRLTLTEAEAVLAAVPGSKLRRPSAAQTVYHVDIRSLAAVAFVDRVVDLLDDSRHSRLSAALDEVDESARTRTTDRGPRA